MEQLKTYRQVNDFKGTDIVHFNMLAGEKLKLSGSTVYRSNKIELPTLEKIKIREDYFFCPFRLLNRLPGLTYKDSNFYRDFNKPLEEIVDSYKTDLYLCGKLLETYKSTETTEDIIYCRISADGIPFIKIRDYKKNLSDVWTQFELVVDRSQSEWQILCDLYCKNDWRLVPTFILKMAQYLGIYNGQTEFKYGTAINEVTSDMDNTIQFYLELFSNLFSRMSTAQEVDIGKMFATPLSVEDFYLEQARFKTYVDVYNYDIIINLEYTASTLQDPNMTSFITVMLRNFLYLMPVMFWKLPFKPLALTPTELDKPILNPFDLTKDKLEMRLGQPLDNITYDKWLQQVLGLWNNAERVKQIAKKEFYLNESEIREVAGVNTADLHACINGGDHLSISVSADEIGIFFINTYLDYKPVFNYEGTDIPTLTREDLFKPLSVINNKAYLGWDLEYIVMTRSLIGLKPNRIATGSVFSPLENRIYPALVYGKWNENYLDVFNKRVPLITMYRGYEVESDIFIH